MFTGRKKEFSAVSFACGVYSILCVFLFGHRYRVFLPDAFSGCNVVVDIIFASGLFVGVLGFLFSKKAESNICQYADSASDSFLKWGFCLSVISLFYYLLLLLLFAAVTAIVGSSLR